MARATPIPIITLTPQQRADILLAEWQRLRRERGVLPGQMLIITIDDFDNLTAHVLREAI
jgi:hypothetical protein